MINGAEYQRRFGDVDSDFEDVVKKVPRRKRTKKKGEKKGRWEVKKSRQRDDEKYPGQDPGLGLFTKRPGDHVIRFRGKNTVVILIKELSKEQHVYKAESGFDEDYVVVPTQESLLRNKPDFFWRVQHNRTNPTHRLGYYDYGDYLFLVPLLTLNVGDEITFDYNF